MNIIVISTLSRPDLLRQTLDSLQENAAKDEALAHTYTLVVDGPRWWTLDEIGTERITVIVNPQSVGASRCRNIGAGSIPKYLRQEFVMFVDDDCFFPEGWDRALVNAAESLPEKILLSPYGHPFNIEEARDGIPFVKFPLLISSVAAFMRWKAFDEIGYWLEPGGASGSEDFELCSRARNLGYDFAVLDPHACIHTGMTSSNGKPIIGADLLKERNADLERFYGIEGRVIYG